MSNSNDEENSDSGSSDTPLVIISTNSIQNHQDSSKQDSVYKKATIILSILLFLTCCCIIAITTYFTLSHKDSEKTVDVSDRSWFFHLSDVHLDIYYNETVDTDNHCRSIQNKKGDVINFTQSVAHYGRVKCDSSLSLLTSTANKIKEINKNLKQKSEFILLTGDQAAHDYADFKINALDSIYWSIVNSTSILHSITLLPILFTIGNNDLPADYEPPVDEKHSNFYGKLADRLQDYIFPPSSKFRSLNNLTLFRETFNEGGFYAVNIAEQFETIMLNSNYWSSRCFKKNPRITQIGDLQMKWLEKKLKEASLLKKKVYLCGHIPPGFSAYKDEGSFLLKNYTDAYVKLVYSFEHVIAGQFFGHVHRDRIKIQNLEDKFEPPYNIKGKSTSGKKSYLLIAPSITPVYANNPAFRLVSFNKNSLDLKDYTQYYMDLTLSNVYSKPLWKKEYSFSETYNGDLNSQTIQKLVTDLLAKENSSWFMYMSHMLTMYGGKSTKDIFVEYCSAQHVSQQANIDCLSYYK